MQIPGDTVPERFVPILHGGVKLKSSQALAPSVCELYAIIHACDKMRNQIAQAHSVLLMTDSRTIKVAVAHSLHNTVYSKVHSLLLMMQQYSCKILLTSFSNSESTFVDYLSRLDIRPKLKAAINMLTDPDLDRKLPVKAGQFYVTDIDHIRYDLINDPDQMSFMIKHEKDRGTFEAYWNSIKERDKETPWFKRIHDKMLSTGQLSLHTGDLLEKGKDAAAQVTCIDSIDQGHTFHFPTPEEIRNAQKTHETWGKVYLKLQNGQYVRKQYSLYNGVIMTLKHPSKPENDPKNIKVVVVPSRSELEYSLLLAAHRTHSGARKAAKMLESMFFIKNAERKMNAITASCALCSTGSPYKREYISRGHLVVRKAYGVMQLMAIDHMKMDAFKQFKYILVCVDSASRYAFLKAVKSEQAVDTRAVLHDLFNTLGRTPKAILCDNASGLYLSTLMHKYCKRMGIEFYNSTPYNSRSNSQVESMNSTIRCLINKLMRERNIKNWPSLVGETMAYINNTPRKILGYKTPVEIFMGHPPLGPDALMIAGDSENSRTEESLEERIKRIRETREEVAKSLKEKDRRPIDPRSYFNNNKIKKGSIVLYRDMERTDTAKKNRPFFRPMLYIVEKRCGARLYLRSLFEHDPREMRKIVDISYVRRATPRGVEFAHLPERYKKWGEQLSYEEMMKYPNEKLPTPDVYKDNRAAGPPRGPLYNDEQYDDEDYFPDDYLPELDEGEDVDDPEELMAASVVVPEKQVRFEERSKEGEKENNPGKDGSESVVTKGDQSLFKTAKSYFSSLVKPK